MREYALVFAVAAGVTYLLAVVARVLALRVGALATVRDRDVHAIPIPYLGGVAMLGGLAAALLVAGNLPLLSTSDAPVFDDAQAVLAGGALMCLVGVLDDIFELDALTKFAGQLLAAGVVAYLGVQLQWLPLPNGEPLSMDPSQSPLITVFLVVATVNAVNFVDGLDGLAAGVIGIGAIAFFAYAYLLVRENEQSLALTAAILTAALAGVCVGFLPHNFYPARIFMGDSGSMLIGLVLAGGALTFSGQLSVPELTEGVAGADAGLQAALLPVLLPVAILMVPFLDLDAGDAHVHVVREALLPAAVQPDVRDALRDAVDQPVAEGLHPGALLSHRGQCDLARFAQTDDAGDVVRARALAALLRAAVQIRGKPDSLADVERADALRPVELVAREREHIHAQFPDVDGHLADRLRGVRVEENPLLPGDPADLRDRLNHADLVVRVHDGDQHGLVGDGASDGLRVNKALAIHRRDHEVVATRAL